MREIKNICRQYGIKKYTINDDGSIDVDGSVDLTRWEMNEFPLTFNKVTKGFYASHIGLKTLKGGPKWVGKDYDCGCNRLTTLKGSPEYVGKNFNCDSQEGPEGLTSLEFGPTEVGGDYNFDGNDIYNFDFLENVKVGGIYDVHWCPIWFIFYNNTTFFELTPYMVSWFIKAKVFNGKKVNLKRLKYISEMFDIKVDINSVEKYYEII
jgi:hypothetical protein